MKRTSFNNPMLSIYSCLKTPYSIKEKLFRTIAVNCGAALEYQINSRKKTEKTPEIDEERRQCAELSSQLDFRMNEIINEILRRKSEDK